MLKEMTAYSIRISVVRSPSGKRFSICLNGACRTCAIVQVASPVFIKYILEVARPDDWSISTLILESLQNVTFKSIEIEIKLLLEGVVQKSGHWDKYFIERIKQLSIRKVKHDRGDLAKE